MLKYIKKNLAVATLASILSMSLVAPVYAHKVVADAYASDDVIEGEVGFSNGDMAVGILVEVFDPAGNKLGEVTTDEEGFFLFKPTQVIEHVFRANLGAGHVAEFKVAVEDLPVIDGAAAPVTTTVSEVASETQQMTASVSQVSSADLRGIKQELKLMRKEIAAYKEKNDFQNILGGLGYIIGLCGLYVFFLARREKKQAAKG